MKAARLVVCLGLLVALGAAVFFYLKRLPLKNAYKQPGSMEWPIGWAADFTVHSSTDPSKNCTGRMYVNDLVEPRGMRRETVCGDRKRISIFTGGTAVVLDPDAKTYWKPHVESRLVSGQDPSKRLIGREVVDGRQVDHFEQHMPEPDGTTVVAQVWEDTRLHSPLRVVKPNETYELTTIREGAQPKSLFAVPDGYREIEVPKEP